MVCQLTSTDPVVVERVENPMPQLAFCHRSGHFQLPGAAAVCFGQRRAAGFTGFPYLPCHTGLLVNGTPAGLAQQLEDLLAAAGVQAAGGGGGGQAVGVPVVGELVLQR